MSGVEILAVALGVSMDAFAVAIAVSIALGRVSGRQVFRLGFHFGLFQAIMPVIGWLAGSSMNQWMTAWDHWIAFGLLGFIGSKAVYEGLARGRESTPVSDATRGLRLVTLSVATSVDALAVGLGLAILDVSIWYPCAFIGLTTGSLTVVGMVLGSRLGARFGRRTEVAGGLVLIGIGLKILIQHLG